MKKNVMDMLNKLEGYKVAVKNLHWSSESMDEHKQCDDIAEKLDDYEDKIAEIAQGMYGQVKKNELWPTRVEVTTLSRLVKQVLNDAIKFNRSLKNEKDVGLKSETDAFIGTFGKENYLVDDLVEEMVDRIVKETINECRRARKRI